MAGEMIGEALTFGENQPRRIDPASGGGGAQVGFGRGVAGQKPYKTEPSI